MNTATIDLASIAKEVLDAAIEDARTRGGGISIVQLCVQLSERGIPFGVYRGAIGRTLMQRAVDAAVRAGDIRPGGIGMYAPCLKSPA